MNSSALLLALTLIQVIKTPVEYLFHFYVADWKTILNQHFFILLFMPFSGIIVTALYPVLISSKKGTVDLLKKLRTVQMPWWIRSMVTMQYAAAVVLLIWIGSVYFQLDYILNKDTGINQNGVLAVDLPLRQKGKYTHKLDYFINSARAINGIRQASVSKSVMGDHGGVPVLVKRSENGIAVGLYSNGVVDENFLDLYSIRMVEGRKFRANQPADQKSVLLSRNAVKRLGFSSPKESIGARIILPNNINNVEIIGVYADYEFQPYFAERQADGASSLLSYKNSIFRDIDASKISFKINLKNATSIISELEGLYKATFPQDIFNWTFLDQNINRHYAQEQIARNQIMLFTLLAIGIACLGLLGTTTNNVIERPKKSELEKYWERKCIRSHGSY